MPGVRFQEVRSLVSMAQVLDLLGFVAHEASRDEVRGRCPVHGSTLPKSRSFSANLNKGVYRCFRCGSAGNQSGPLRSRHPARPLCRRARPVWPDWV